MTRVTVCHHPGVEDDLAAIWVVADDRELLARAAHEIDELLRFDPSRKGNPVDVALLDDESRELLSERIGDIPDDLRWFPLGPLEVFFTAHEFDGQARVWVMRLRSW